MSYTPTDEQIEKHARVGYDFDEEHRVLFGYQTEPLPFESLPQWAQDTHRDKARAQLVAVGPSIAAQAWDEGAATPRTHGSDLPVSDNPYREQEAR